MGEAEEGKAAAKAELRRRMNLSNANVPLVGVVTRLTHQKGIHLIKHAAWRTLERGGQFVLLGSAPDPKVQAEFNALAGDLGKQYPDRARLWFAYDEPLSHLIYAGCDMFLVPSVFEPCGLTQMIAMRYALTALHCFAQRYMVVPCMVHGVRLRTIIFLIRASMLASISSNVKFAWNYFVHKACQTTDMDALEKLYINSFQA